MNTLSSPEFSSLSRSWVASFPATILTLFAIFGSSASLSAQDLRRQVGELAVNDKRQDLRLYNLERDVDYLQRRVGSGSGSYTPPTLSGKSISSGKSPATPAAYEAPAPATTSYTVKAGDTLWRIAMNHRVSPGEIMQLNGLPNDQVRIGQKLSIPAKGAPAKAPPKTQSPAPTRTSSQSTSTSGQTHTIAKGDTFSQIAQRYGVSQAALQQANPGVNPDLIVLGATLKIPASSASSPIKTATTSSATIPSPAPAPTPAPAPAPRVTGRQHTVAQNETLSGIAGRYGVSLAALQQANNVTDPTKLRIGQTLTIPGGSGSKPAEPAGQPSAPAYAAEPQPIKPPSGAATPPAAPGTTPSPGPLPQPNHRGVLSYRVDQTDTIESIAATFGTTPQRIRELNRLSPTAKLQPNDEILVPAMGAVSL